MSPFCIFMVQWTYYILYRRHLQKGVLLKHTAPTTTLESRTLWHNIVSTIIILAIATILAFSFFHITQSDPANIALIYILALIIIARITTGYFFGIISAFFCVIFINWCFTYPYFEVSFDQRISCNICISSYHLHDRLYPDYTIKKTG